MPLASPWANSLPKLEADLLSGPRGMSGESAPMLPRRGPEADKLEKEKLQQCKTKIRMDDFVFASFVSPSGNGIKIFVKVSSVAEQHKETFLALQRYFEELLAVEIDKSGKDITRLCFFSYDPELYLNENAETFYPNTEKGSKENEQKTKSENIKSAI